MTDSTRASRKRSIFQLVADIPTIVTDLVKGEIELLKAEIIGKLKAAGIGVGLVAIAAVFLLMVLAMLLTSAVFAFSQIMPGWAAALLVAGIVLVIAGILAWIGIVTIKKQMPPLPERTIASLKADVNTIKGIGQGKS
jgi:Putative Actinobacterial Holin-X, holin superfamily III